MATLYVPIGVSGSGKSTLLRDMSVRVVSSDGIRREAGLAPNARVWDQMTRQTMELLESGESVAYDATNLKRTRRASLVGQARRACDDLRVVALLVLAPQTEAYERNQARDEASRVPEDVLAKQLMAFHVPMATEGYDEIRVVRTSSATSVPSWDDLDAFDQQNPHHTLTLGRHMAATEERVARACRETDVPEDDASELTVAARWHDVGKTRTQTFRTHSGRRSDIAHYYGHENVGAHMLLAEILPETNPELDDEAMLRVATTVAWHMRPYAWAQGRKAKARDDRFLTSRLLRDVRMLHAADEDAH